MHSDGLLLLTNDGQLAHSLMHPSHEVYKEYLVKLTPDEEGLPSPEKLLSGVIELDGERLLPAKCRLLTKTENGYIMTIAIRQGKNRQIRRMCAKCGYTVNSLKRVSEGDVKLGELPSGRWRYLTEAEVRYLKSL
jgi:23S rRNA pseudouridine2605 synthase